MRARTHVSSKKKALAALSAGDHIIGSAGLPTSHQRQPAQFTLENIDIFSWSSQTEDIPS